MLIITSENKISVAKLDEMAKKMFGNLVKAVVDIEKEIMAVDGELHADEELLLMEKGSKRSDVWGINIYPQFNPEDEKFIEFDSMINIKPSFGNHNRGIDDQKIKDRILKIVKILVSKNEGSVST